MSAFTALRPAGIGQLSTGGAAGDTSHVAIVGIAPHPGPIGRSPGDDPMPQAAAAEVSTPPGFPSPGPSQSGKHTVTAATIPGAPSTHSANPSPPRQVAQPHAAAPDAGIGDRASGTSAPAVLAHSSASPSPAQEAGSVGPTSPPSGGVAGHATADATTGPAVHCLHGHVRGMI